MKNKYYLTVGLLIGGVLSAPVQAHEMGYLTDSSGKVVRTQYGDCVLSSGTNAKMAAEECGDAGMKAKPADMVMDADGDGVADKSDQCADTAAGIRVDSRGCPADSDKDGVADSYDQCPGTPAGVDVFANGCPADSDNDGVADNKDQCPDTAASIKVDARGCPADSDNDGVADSYDQCPNTSAGVEVYANGCDVNRDSDNDGIVDASDNCPNTAAGTAVDRTGCELKADIRLDDVRFQTATAILSPESRRILDGVAQTLKQNQHLNFEIAGHTDDRGDYNYNVQLSRSRAESVRDYLISQGVSGDRLVARGYGPDKPVASNDTRSGRSQNRRVELVLQ